MTKKETFPKAGYAVFDDGHLIFGENLSAMVDMEETVKVGVYQLVEVIDVEGKAVIVR
jgi:hypothetical protein